MDKPTSFKRPGWPEHEIKKMKEAHRKDLQNERRFIAAKDIARALIDHGVELDPDWIARQAVKIADALLDELS